MKTIQDNIANLDRLVQLLTETEISNVTEETDLEARNLFTAQDKRVQELEQEIKGKS